MFLDGASREGPARFQEIFLVSKRAVLFYAAASYDEERQWFVKEAAESLPLT
jgi:hypothetical protein